MKFKVKISASQDGGFWAEALELPGCVTEGETLDEIRPRILEALSAWTGENITAGEVELDIPVSNI